MKKGVWYLPRAISESIEELQFALERLGVAAQADVNRFHRDGHMSNGLIRNARLLVKSIEPLICIGAFFVGVENEDAGPLGRIDGRTADTFAEPLIHDVHLGER